MDRDVLVIGVGQDLRGDDGVGWRVVEALLAAGCDWAETMQVPQLTPELSECVASAKAVVFVDASRSGRAGEVYVREVSPLGASGPLSHITTTEELLCYAQQLFGGRPKCVLVTICGEQFEVGTGLSEGVARAVPVAVRQILDWCSAWRDCDESAGEVQ